MKQEDRLAVQTTLGVNLVVEAGAGTGKTTALIDRICLSILVQKIPVEKLVALTFTEKAAAEIKTRLLFKLEQLLHAIHTQTQDRTLDLLRTYFSVPETELALRAQEALSRLDRAAIGTIHSFCADILKSFPLEAGLSPQAEIDSGQKSLELFEMYWNRFLDVQLGLNAPQAPLWKQVLAQVSLEDLKSFARELAAITPVDYDYYRHASFFADLCTQKSAFLKTLYTAYAPKKPRNIEKALLWAATSLERTRAFLQGKEIPPVSPDTCPALTTTPVKGWDETDYEQARQCVDFAQKVTPENQQLFLTAEQLIGPLARQVRQACEEEGIVSFDALIIKTRNLLAQNLYVRRILKEKFDVLFIDEFQDTDPLQGELLLFLAEEKPGAAAHWQEVTLQPGKLFVVGDPKQSIYRFRGADISAYELFTNLIIKQGGKKCFLRNNFRSEPGILETANQICSRAMREQPSFQPAYEPIFTTQPDRGPSVQWLFVTAPENQSVAVDDLRHNQAQAIAQWIKQQVGTCQLKNGQKLAYRDIAILMRAGTTSSMYAEALRRHAIPFTTEIEKDFFKKQEINDLLLFLRALADPHDKIALTGVLRSPLGGLTDEQLYQLAQQHALSLTQLVTLPHTQEIARTLLHYSHLAGRISVPELIEHILAHTFLPAVCAVAYEGEKSVACLNQFAALSRQYAQDAPLSLASFLARLPRLLEDNPQTFSALAEEESTDAVSLLTVHKSKGLEFPVVILADVSRKETASSHPDPHLFSWQHNLYGLRVGPVRDIQMAFLEEEQKKHSQCEEIRILYVALTRAKEKLLLVADNRPQAAQVIRAFTQAGLFPDGTSKTLVCPDKVTLPVTYYPFVPPKEFLYTVPMQASTIQELDPALSHWLAAYTQRKQMYETLLTQSRQQSPSSSETLLTEQQRQAAQLGTVCHRALELLVSRQVRDVAQACTQAAHDGATPHLADQALTLLQPFTQSALYTQICQCKLVACEMPFTVLLPDGSAQNGVMDCVVETPQGLWILDYKTDQVIPGQEPTLFTQKYQTQLAAYRQAAEKIFPGKPIRASVLFIRTFAVIDL